MWKPKGAALIWDLALIRGNMLFIYLFIYLFICLFIYLFIYLLIYLFIYLFIYLYSFTSFKIEKKIFLNLNWKQFV